MCNIYQKLSVWLYHFGKFVLYIILVLRVKVVFNGSTFHQFVTKMVRIMYVLLAIFMMVYWLCEEEGSPLGAPKLVENLPDHCKWREGVQVWVVPII